MASNTGLVVENEVLGDIPLLLNELQDMKIDEIVECCFGTHGLQQGLKNGQLAVGWLSYILSQKDHRMNTVQEWAQTMLRTLSAGLGTPIREIDFSDDRLANFLDRLSDDASWSRAEDLLTQRMVSVYELALDIVRLDGTTFYGHHDVTEDGLMQYGASKDRRSDLPQVKLMGAALDPGILIAVDIVSGEQNDDGLYVPLIERTRKMLARNGLLYVGDCKMSSRATRATIQSNGDYYLTPLQLGTENIRKKFSEWVEKAVNGEQELKLIFDTENEMLGAGYETSREELMESTEKNIRWDERLFIFRSSDFAQSENEMLHRALSRAEQKLQRLAEPLKKGQRRHRDIDHLKQAVDGILKENNVVGLLEMHFKEIQDGKNQAYLVTDLKRNEEAIAERIRKNGWRVMATNFPKDRLDIGPAIKLYRDNWRLERNFRTLKKTGLEASPLYVRKDERIKGLIRFLSLAARILTIIEVRIRKSLAKAKETISGLTPGQPNRLTDTPTAISVLKAFCRLNIVLTRISSGEQVHWHITPLPPNLQQILKHLGINQEIYQTSGYEKLT